MYYLTYRGRKIDILKCARCRGYSLQLSSTDQTESTDDRNHYDFTCDKCGASGSVQISAKLNFESFNTWENLQDRIDELKVAMTLTRLK